MNKLGGEQDGAEHAVAHLPRAAVETDEDEAEGEAGEDSAED